MRAEFEVELLRYLVSRGCAPSLKLVTSAGLPSCQNWSHKWLWEGHDFSRAAWSHKDWALAPEALLFGQHVAIYETSSSHLCLSPPANGSCKGADASPPPWSKFVVREHADTAWRIRTSRPEGLALSEVTVAFHH